MVSVLHCKESSGSHIMDLEWDPRQLEPVWPVTEMPGQTHFGKCSSLAGVPHGGLHMPTEYLDLRAYIYPWIKIYSPILLNVEISLHLSALSQCRCTVIA